MYEATAPFYDLFDADDADARRHCDFVLGYARAMTHALDVGAGTGVLALHLARNGVQTWAVEPSAAMRGAMLAALASDTSLDRRLTIVPADGRSVRLRRTFPLVCATHTLYLIERDAELHATLKNIRAHAEPGALFIGDFALAAGRKARPRALAAARRIGEHTYARYSSTRRLDARRWAVVWSIEVSRGDELLERVEEEFVVRVRSADACRNLLRRHGFDIERECAGYDGARLENEAEASRYVFVARAKPGSHTLRA